VIQQQFAIIHTLLYWEVAKCCVIIESGQEEPVVDDWPFDHQGTLAQLDQVLNEFAAFLTMHQEIRDAHVHIQLLNGLVENLWERRGNAA
jgi:hypothetical protein